MHTFSMLGISQGDGFSVVDLIRLQRLSAYANFLDKVSIRWHTLRSVLELNGLPS